jgi:hypothetical protein
MSFNAVVVVCDAAGQKEDKEEEGDAAVRAAAVFDLRLPRVVVPTGWAADEPRPMCGGAVVGVNAKNAAADVATKGRRQPTLLLLLPTTTATGREVSRISSRKASRESMPSAVVGGMKERVFPSQRIIMLGATPLAVILAVVRTCVVA